MKTKKVHLNLHLQTLKKTGLGVRRSDYHSSFRIYLKTN